MPVPISFATSIEDAMASSESVQQGLDLYSNLQRVTVTKNELVIDFFAALPARGKLDSPKVVHLQRVIVPIPVGLNLANIITTTTEAAAKANLDSTTD